MDGELLLKISNDVSAIKENINVLTRTMQEMRNDIDKIREKVQSNENKINHLEGKLKGQKYITITISTIVGTISWIAGLIIGKFL